MTFDNMEMKREFNHISDIKGEDKVFPADKNGYALFFTEDHRFFIYALYTKSDLSAPELFEVNFDSYMGLRSEGVVENVADDINHLADILVSMKREAFMETVNVIQVLELDEIK